MQADASEKNLKEAKSPRVLHIATHGFFLPETENTEEKVFGIEAGKLKENPMLRSGLMLAGAEKVIEGSGEDGILTAYEAMNLSLENTEIVVMSACETGLGDVKNGEGVYGLQRAFKVAGANAIIMSLWKVNDDATQELMTLFYKYYAVSGNKQDAFKKAQLELKTKFKDPYYWGAFVLVE
jgi:CHAT domain-containing protein